MAKSRDDTFVEKALVNPIGEGVDVRLTVPLAAAF
jgi:hypothetical protein